LGPIESRAENDGKKQAGAEKGGKQDIARTGVKERGKLGGGRQRKRMVRRPAGPSNQGNQNKKVGRDKEYKRFYHHRRKTIGLPVSLQGMGHCNKKKGRTKGVKKRKNNRNLGNAWKRKKV